jgi:hypothetical protein
MVGQRFGLLLQNKAKMGSGLPFFKKFIFQNGLIFLDFDFG